MLAVVLASLTSRPEVVRSPKMTRDGPAFRLGHIYNVTWLTFILLKPGGKHFSRSLQPVDADGNQISMWSADAKDEESEEEDDSEEDSSDDSDDAEADPSKTAADAENREDRKALKKARKEAAIAKQKSRTVEVGDLPSSDEESDDDEGMPANPNHSKAARKQTKPVTPDVDEITEGVSNMNAPANRKEREALEAAAAKEKYMKLQAEGKTDQAKADLARLKLIREQRATDAARRQVWKPPPRTEDLATSLSFATLYFRTLTHVRNRLRRKRGMSKKRLARQRLTPKRPRSVRLLLAPRRPARRSKLSTAICSSRNKHQYIYNSL